LVSKKGGGVVRPAPAPPPVRALSRHAEAAIVFLHLSSFAIRWTVPVPMPNDLATFRIPASLRIGLSLKLGRCRYLGKVRVISAMRISIPPSINLHRLKFSALKALQG
jgi:hypothetical protein